MAAFSDLGVGKSDCDELSLFRLVQLDRSSEVMDDALGDLEAEGFAVHTPLSPCQIRISRITGLHGRCSDRFYLNCNTAFFEMCLYEYGFVVVVQKAHADVQQNVEELVFGNEYVRVQYGVVKADGGVIVVVSSQLLTKLLAPQAKYACR